MDRRTLLAISLCFLIFIGWQKYYIEPRTVNGTVAPRTSSDGASPLQAPVSSSKAPDSLEPQKRLPRPEATLSLRTRSGEVTVSDLSNPLKDWSLSSYRESLSTDSPQVRLSRVSLEPGELEVAFDDPRFAYLNAAQGVLKATPQGATWTYEDELVRLVREFKSQDNAPFLEMELSFAFKTEKRPKFAFVSVTAGKPGGKDPEEQDRQVLYFTNNSVERVHLKNPSLTEVQTPVGYIGAATRYFVLAVVPSPVSPEARGLVQPVGSDSVRASLVYPVSSASGTLPFRIYFGPKDLNILRSIDPRLDHVVDFGWFTLFAYPLIKLLKWLYQFVGNYGVAIILLTLMLKAATFPLTYKSMKSMKEMAKIQPQIQRLRERHGEDKEAFNREMLTLMKSHGYNPMAGCLPIVVQMPIFFALYRVLYGSIELYQAPFAFWIHDLSAHDPFYVTPVVLTVTMWLQQKLTPNTSTDPVQARMLQFMPVIFGVFMLALPAGLTVYMLVNALASIVQQIVLNKKFDKGNVAAVPASAR